MTPMIAPRVPKQDTNNLDPFWKPHLKYAIGFLNAYIELAFLQDEITEATHYALRQCVMDLDTALFGKCPEDCDE